MKIFGLQIGKKQTGQSGQTADKTKQSLRTNLEHYAHKVAGLALHYQISIIALAVAGLLALTALRMLHYMNPPADANRLQQNLAKTKQTHIDPKIVQKIQQLQSSGTSTTPNIQNGRSNPFAE